MKKLFYLIPVLLVFTAFFYSCSPKTYSTAADTVNLNKEYRVLLRDVVNLNAKIEKAKSDIPVLKAKADKASAKSKESLEESRRQAAVATGGSLKQIRKAESKADDAQDDAEDYKSAHNKLIDAQEKLVDMQTEVAKKEARLQELDKQKQSINAS